MNTLLQSWFHSKNWSSNRWFFRQWHFTDRIGLTKALQLLGTIFRRFVPFSRFFSRLEVSPGRPVPNGRKLKRRRGALRAHERRVVGWKTANLEGCSSSFSVVNLQNKRRNVAWLRSEKPERATYFHCSCVTLPSLAIATRSGDSIQVARSLGTPWRKRRVAFEYYSIVVRDIFGEIFGLQETCE